VTATLGDDFVQNAQVELVDEAERELVGKRGNLLFESIRQSHDRLDVSEYDTDPVKESLVAPEADRSDDDITVTWGWEHEAAGFFEFGTRPHTIEGDPVLSFVWEDPPGWVRDEFDQARDSGGRFRSGWRVFFGSVDVDGITELAFVRAGLAYLKGELR
jgi:hypothetical protein